MKNFRQSGLSAQSFAFYLIAQAAAFISGGFLVAHIPSAPTHLATGELGVPLAEDIWRVGVSTNGHNRSKKGKIKIHPLEANSSLTFSSSDSSMLKVEPENFVETERGITYTGLKGSTKEGDVSIDPSVTGKLSTLVPTLLTKKQKVSVIIPKSVDYTKKSAPTGVATSNNRIVGPVAVANPPPGTPPGTIWVFRATLWYHPTTISVLDNLKKPLDDIYENAVVTENGGKGIGITPPTLMTASGTYIDPVGLQFVVVPPIHSTDPAAAAWPTSGSTAPVVNTPAQGADVDVEVDGFALDAKPTKSISGRTSEGVSPDVINVAW